MIDDTADDAFKRIANISIGVVGDDCKDDLILIGLNLGMTDLGMREQFSYLYERGTDNITEEDFKEDEELLTDEEESKTDED